MPPGPIGFGRPGAGIFHPYTPPVVGRPTGLCYRDTILSDTPVGYWRLGEPSGNPADSSGQGNNVSGFIGSPTYGVAGALSGDANTAMAFTAASRMLVPYSASLNVADNFSVELWLKSNGNFFATGGVFEQDYTAETVPDMFIDGSGFPTMWSNGTGGVGRHATCDTAILDTNWHHLVFTKNGATSHWYFDGAQTPDDIGAAVTYTSLGAGNTTWLAGERGSGSGYEGAVDEIALYNYALPAARVAAHFAAAPVFCPDAPRCYRDTVIADGPATYWRLGETTGTSAADQRGGVVNGTYVNTPTLGVSGALSGDTDTAISLASASSQYVSVADNVAFHVGNGAQSWEFWVAQVSRSATYIIIDKGGGTVGTGSPQVRLNQNVAGDIEWRCAGSAIIAHTGALITDAAFHHVVVTKASGNNTGLIYLDGVDVTIPDSAGFTIDNTAALRIGSQDAAPFDYLDGSLDEVAFYNYVLSPAQISQHYAARVVSCTGGPHAYQRALSAALTFIGAQGKLTRYPLTATANFIGSLSRRTGKALAATLNLGRPTYIDTVTADLPVAYWRLDEASGLPVDAMGTNNVNGVVSTPTYSVAGALTGVADTAIAFPGVSNFTVPDNASLNFGDVFSVEFWILRSAGSITDGNNHGIWYKGNIGGTSPHVFIGPSDLPTLYSQSTGAVAYGTAITDTTTWHHLVVIKSGSTVHWYQDGVQTVDDLGTAFTFGNSSDGATLGASRNASNSALAALDEVALYNYALSAAQIAAHYRASQVGNTLVKRSSRGLAGGLAFVGAQSRRISHGLAATLSFAGTTARLTSRALTATLSFVGSFTGSRLAIRAFTATLSFSGAQVRRTNRALTATLSFVGSQARRTVRALAATLSFVGSTTKRTARALAATLSFVGSLAGNKITGTQTYQQALTATLSFVGAINRQVSYPLTATLSFAGAMSRRTARALAATLSFAGTTTRQVSRALAATLSFVGAFSRRTNKALAATLSFVGTTSRTLGRQLAATLSFTGSISKRIARALTATLGLSAVLGAFKIGGPIVYQQAVAGTLAFAGTINRRTSYLLSATLSFAGNVNRQVRRSLTATLSFVGSTAAGHLFIRALAGTLSFSGSIARRTGKALAGTLSFAGAISRRVVVVLASTLSFIGAIGRSFPYRLAGATLSFVGSFLAVLGGSSTGGFPPAAIARAAVSRATATIAGVVGRGTSSRPGGDANNPKPGAE